MKAPKSPSKMIEVENNLVDCEYPPVPPKGCKFLEDIKIHENYFTPTPSLSHCPHQRGFGTQTLSSSILEK